MLIPWLSHQLHHQSEIGESVSLSKAKTHAGLTKENDIRRGSCWQIPSWRLAIALAFGISGAIASLPDCASAQVTADPTLGTTVTINGSTFQIRGGTLVDGSAIGGTKNLFHSFSSFSIPSEEIADFLNDSSINNILARVTGGTQSNIQGLIRAQGNANLFLINPNGIIFGPGAQLNIGGSFVATTANAIQFPGGGEFSVNSTVDSGNPLLKVNPSAFFFNQIANQQTPAIEVRNGAVLSVGFSNLANPGNLLLVGGNVLIDGGNILNNPGNLQGAPGSDIQLGGFTGKGSVELIFDNNNKLRLNLPATGLPAGIVGANVSLTNRAGINLGTETDNAGNILLTGGTVSLTGGSFLSSSTFGAGDAGSITLQAEKITIDGSSNIFSTAEAGSSGDAGNIAIDAGSFVLNNSKLDTDNNGTGTAGKITIITRNGVAITNSAIFSESQDDIKDNTNFGTIQIEATKGSVFVDNSTIKSTNTGSGWAGDIRISAQEQVSILNNSEISSNGDFGRILIGSNQYYPDSLSPGIVRIDKESTLATDNLGTGRAGDIIVSALDEVSLAGNSKITSKSDNENQEEFGSIRISATQGSVLLNNATISTTNFGSGLAGDISITARDQVSIKNNSGIFSRGNVGQIFIGESDYADFSPQRVAIDSSTVNTENSSVSDTNEEIDAGNIFIRANDSVIFTNLTGNNKVTTSTSGTGNAGYVFVQADRVSLDNSRIESIVKPKAEGDGGYIEIEAGAIALKNSTLETQTFGIGNAGYVDLQTNGGSVSLEQNSNIFSTVEAGGTGDGGNIEIKTGSLLLSNSSSLQTLVRGGEGDAGFVDVKAERDVSITGGGNFATGIFSTVEPGAKGTAGDIEISARSLYLRNGAKVSVDNQGTQRAGNITIAADEDIFLLDQSRISAITAYGEGGDIQLKTGDFLVLLDNSNISTNAGEALGAGNGGKMVIEARYIFGVPVNDNNITAQAYKGKGGSIRVRTNGLYSIDYRPQDFAQTNDITVSSTFGIDGEVEINNLNIDFTQGLTSLPELPVDVSRQITPRCAALGRDSQTEINKFTITGRGGLPPNPNDTLQHESMQINWVTTDPPVENSNGDDSSAKPDSSFPSESNVPKTQALVEAQGWVYGSNGEVILTAQSPTVTPHNPSLTPAASCNAN